MLLGKIISVAKYMNMNAKKYFSLPPTDYTMNAYFIFFTY